MRWAVLFLLVFVLVGCQSIKNKGTRDTRVKGDIGQSVTLEEYLKEKRQLNETYLYGSPDEALKALVKMAKLEEKYARVGQWPIESDQARVLVYSRLFVLSEKLMERPEAEAYLTKALHYAEIWKPEVGALPIEKRVDFIRKYVDEFEKGLVVRWKQELK
jgi:hypothetical protein